MNNELKVAESIEISADRTKVWDALVNPEKIKVYLFGTQASSNWTKGAEIVFQGEFQGQKYRDKGIILEIIENEVLQYHYWSAFTGLEELPENYSLVTYRLDSINGNTRLFLSQVGFVNEQSQQHSQAAWASILQEIKAMTEKE